MAWPLFMLINRISITFHITISILIYMPVPSILQQAVAKCAAFIISSVHNIPLISSLDCSYQILRIRIRRKRVSQKISQNIFSTLSSCGDISEQN